MTEPTSGSDTLALRTTAVLNGDHYLINGQKIWTSRAEHSDLMLLLARTTPQAEVAKRTDGLSVFLIDMRKAQGSGLSIRPIRTMMNHSTTEVFFENLKIPTDALVGERGRGFHYILDGMNAERTLIAAECVGDGRWFIDKATAYARERRVFGRPIGQNQGIQFPLARAYAAISARRTSPLATPPSVSSPARRIGEEANVAKLLACRSLVAGGRRSLCADLRRLSRSRRSTTSNVSIAKRGFIKWHRCRPI